MTIDTRTSTPARVKPSSERLDLSRFASLTMNRGGSPALELFPIQRPSFGESLDVIDAGLPTALLVVGCRSGIGGTATGVSSVDGCLDLLPVRLAGHRILGVGPKVVLFLEFGQALGIALFVSVEVS